MSKTPSPAIEIHPGLVLKGQLSMVNDVVLTGKFEGDLQTLGHLTVASGGEATGTIEAGSLALEPGNQVVAKVKVGMPEPQKTFGLSKKSGISKWPLRFKKLKEFALGRA